MGTRIKSKRNTMDLLTWVLGTASAQFTQGDLVEITSGIAQKCNAAADYPYGFLNSVETDPTKLRPATDFKTTAAGERLGIIKLAGTNVEVETDITPPVNGTAAAVNTSTTTVIFDDAAANGAFVGGQVFIPEIGEQRTITADSKAGSTHTLTVVPAFKRAPTTGDTVRATDFSVGATQRKLNGTTPSAGISAAVGDTGGHLEVTGVDLDKRVVSYICPQLPAV